MSSLGARVRAGFLAKRAWGAECLPGPGGEAWRLVSVPLDVPADPAKPGESHERFSGTRAEAEAFARKRGISLRGMGLAFHNPFVRVRPLPEEGTDPETLAERSLPLGLKPEDTLLRVFRRDGMDFSAAVRADAMAAWLDALPPDLAALRSLIPGALALAPHVAAEPMPAFFAAVYALPDETHVLFFLAGNLALVQNLPAGFSTPESLRMELRKALSYSWELHHAGDPVEAVQIWKGDGGGIVAQTLEEAGFALAAAQWDAALAGIPEEWRTATAMALRAADLERDDESVEDDLPDFGPSGTDRTEAHLSWLIMAGKLAWVGILTTAFLAVSVAILFGAVRVLDHLADSRSREWAEPLSKWERLRGLRTQVDARWARLGGMAARANHPQDQLSALEAALPEGVWLERWESTAPPDSGYRHMLVGYSLSDARIPEFVAALQKSGRFRSVRLRLTEKISGAKVAEQTGLAANKIDLVRFELAAER